MELARARQLYTSRFDWKFEDVPMPESGGAYAAARFHLRPDRIGDLRVLGDRDTVVGPLDRAVEDPWIGSDRSALP